MREVTAGEIGQLVGGEVRGDESRVVTRVAPLDQADEAALSFVASPRYVAYLQATRAGAVLVRSDWVDSVPEGCTAIVVEDPHAALQQLLSAFYAPPSREPGVHPTAVVAASARVSDEASIGPFAVIGDAAEVGASQIGAHAVIGARCRIGDDVTIYPHVTLYHGVVVHDRAVIHSGARIGKEGFGFVWKDGGHRKIPQIGGCVIEEDVEIGANVVIDRGSIGESVVGAGTKIDNLVHLGHNVRVGNQVLLIAQVGVAGSSTIGDGAVLAGQVGVSGHLSVGAGARLGGQAGVISDVPAGETYSGYPARPHRDALRASASLFRVPELLKRLKRLEAAVFGRDEGK